MTVFSDDANPRPNLRAFRLVAAALNAPMAQPTWPDALLDRLTPPLPLVDCDPLSTWGQSSTAEFPEHSSSPLAKPSKPKLQSPQAFEMVTPAEPSDAGRAAAKSSWLNPGGDRLPLADQGDRRPRDRRNSSTPPQPSDSTVPSRPPRETAAPSFSSLRSPSPSLDYPHPWPDLQSQAAPPLTALAEIGRLTGEILTGGTASESPRWVKNRAENASVNPARSLQPFPEPLNTKSQPQANSLPPALTASSSPLPLSSPPPPSPPSSKLNLASLAALYAEASPRPDDAPPFTPAEHRDLAPMPAISNTASTAFSTPALGDVSVLEAALPGLAGDGPGPSVEVAETLTEMVSAILQAQAQRHGVDLS